MVLGFNCMAQQKKDRPTPATWQPSRRDVLRLGGLGGLGLTWPQLLQARDQATGSNGSTFGRAKRVIMLVRPGLSRPSRSFNLK